MNGRSRKLAVLGLCVLAFVGFMGSPMAWADPTVFFSDQFDGTELDASLWATSIATSGVRWCNSTDPGSPKGPGQWVDISVSPCSGATQQAPYGALAVANSALSMSAAASFVFPYVWTLASPFPDTGDFSLELKMKYDTLANRSGGIVVNQIEDPTPQGQNAPAGKSVLRITANVYGMFVSLLDGNGRRTVRVSGPTGYHVIRLDYIGGKYAVYIDGEGKIAPTQSTVLPNNIWIGNPGIYWRGSAADWSGMSLDYIQVTEAQVALPIVTITAPDPTASEVGPSSGSFKISRTGSTDFPLSVKLTKSGSAVLGQDYRVRIIGSEGQAINRLTIPARKSSVVLVVTPFADKIVEGDETVILTIATDASYTVGSPSSATITITDGN